jgi:STE24 endopeptidase
VLNTYALVLLAALVADFALQVAADVLNLRALDPAVPAEFRNVYDAERYRRSQEYTRARTRFGLVTRAIDLVLLLVFWLAGGFAWLDRLVRGPALGPVATGLVFFAALGLGRFVLALPLRWWSTFVLEERFGFNKTTPWTFWTDAAKGLVVAAVLGGPLAALVLWLFVEMGSQAWLWGWLAVAVYLVAVQFIAPTWIMPLFNRFTPLPEGELRDAILGYAREVSFPLEGVSVIDGSRRSSKANAFFTGFGRHKRIALFDTLLATLDPRQILAVLAHEIGHYKRRHVLVGLAIAILHTGLVLFLVALLLDRPGLYRAFGVETPAVHTGLLFAALLLSTLELVLAPLLAAWSRRNEYEADRFAATTTGDGEPLAAALARLSADSLANLTPHPLHVALHYSHPPVLARVRALRGCAG